MAKKLQRWQKESGEFLDALIGGTEPYRDPAGTPPGSEEQSQKEADKEKLLKLRQFSRGGRPKNNASVSDRLTVYNIKIKESELNALRQLAKKRILTIRELFSEAVNDLLEKYKED